MPSEHQVVVAHIVTGLQIGGLERVAVNLVSGLVGPSYRLLVVCLEEGGPFAAEIEKLGVKVVVLGKQPGMSWRTIWHLAKLFRQEKIQIVHTHNPQPHFHGVLAGRLAGVPVRVHTKHGRNYPQMKKRVLLNRVLSWLTDAIVPVSDNTGDVALLIEKVNLSKVHRIWNGVDTELYRPQTTDSELRTRDSGLKTQDYRPPTIGTVARLSPEKDQKTMLAAFKLVLDQWGQTASGQLHAPLREGGILSSNPSSLIPYPSTLPRLVIVGGGPSMAELRNEANRLGIAAQVEFLGARFDIPQQLATFDIFTLSSTTEGISMTILEAMACGVPIVASDVGGNREIVQPPQCGLIVPARDPQALAAAYLELLRNPAQRVQMGTVGRQRVLDHFSLQKMVAEYQMIYKNLLSRHAL